jgi:Fe-S cluster biogenesis protein NfuA
MPDDKDFRNKIKRIGELVGELENIADPELRVSTKSLVQLLLDLHSVGLERAMEIVASAGESGQRTIDELGRDPLVSSLLVLYGLHPLGLESRVAQAVERLQPRVRRAGGKLELLSIHNGGVRLHMRTTDHICGSTAKTIKAMVEDTLYEAAPDLSHLLIEGLDNETGSVGFVSLGKLGGIVAATPAMAEPS